MTCPICDAASDDGLACQSCTDRWVQMIAETPSTLRDLDLVTTRQARYNSTDRRSAETPMPWVESSSEARWVLASAITGAVRWLSERENITQPQPTPESMCLWLLGWVDAWRRDAAARDLFDELSSGHAQADHARDRPADRHPQGPCEACDRPMFTEQEKPGFVECEHCQHTHDWQTLRRQRLDEASSKLLTVTEAARVLATWREPAEPMEAWGIRIKNWIARGRLTQAGTVTIGTDRDLRAYRFCDIAALAEDYASRRGVA